MSKGSFRHDDPEWREAFLPPDHLDCMQGRLDSLMSLRSMMRLAATLHFASVNFGVDWATVLFMETSAHACDCRLSLVPLGVVH